MLFFKNKNKFQNCFFLTFFTEISSSSWNWVDSAGILCFLVGYFLRYAVKEELDECDPYVVYRNCQYNSSACNIECESAEINNIMYYSHVIYCMSFICYSIRLLHVFQMSKNLASFLRKNVYYETFSKIFFCYTNYNLCRKRKRPQIGDDPIDDS